MDLKKCNIKEKQHLIYVLLVEMIKKIQEKLGIVAGFKDFS